MSNLEENLIKVFGMTNQLVLEDLSQVARTFDIELGHVVTTQQAETDYYPQFERSVRVEAAEMARYFEVFYCLEKTIRKLISETLEDAEGDEWWTSSRVTPVVRTDVEKRIKREVDSAMTRRSDDELDYTTFGELSIIICGNWDLFGGILTSQKAVEKIMGNLNSLRGPIAHCSLLAEDEVLRLRLAVRDWFRLME